MKSKLLIASRPGFAGPSVTEGTNERRVRMESNRTSEAPLVHPTGDGRLKNWFWSWNYAPLVP